MKTRNELINLNATLNNQLNKGNSKFKYAVLKNIRLITPEIETLKKIEETNYNIVKEYNETHSAVIRKYGTPEGNQIFIKQDNENFSIAMEELTKINEEYKEQISEYETKMNDYIDFLKEEMVFDFNLHKINPTDLPDDISSEDLGILMLLEIVD